MWSTIEDRARQEKKLSPTQQPAPRGCPDGKARKPCQLSSLAERRSSFRFL